MNTLSDVVDSIFEETEIRENIDGLRADRDCIEDSEQIADVVANLASMYTTCLVLQAEIAKAQGVVRRELLKASSVDSPVEMSETEELAAAIGNDEQLLLRELLESRSLLLTQYGNKFAKYTYDFEAKRLVGADGYTLQWMLRDDPTRPVSYNNQQTSRGTVRLIHSGKE